MNVSAWHDALSYSLADFLLFSPRTYHRLFELYHRDWWPLQVAALVGGLVLFAGAHRGGIGGQRIALGVLALAWGWVAWAFHLDRYATINWAATYFAAGFAAQALLSLLAACLPPAPAAPVDAVLARRLGLALVAAALFAAPWLAALGGRPWVQAELFGFTPDATVLATLGALLVLPRSRWWLWVIPLVWCAVGGATLWTLGDPTALLLPAVGLLALALRTAARR